MEPKANNIAGDERQPGSRKDYPMRKSALASVVILALTPFAAHAHHGWGSYEASTPLTIEAAVESIVWENPHGEMMLPHGGEMWHVTLAPPSRMQMRGLSAEMLQPGTAVAVQGYPSRNIPNEMRAERLIIDGETYELR
jgi:hypothetical protein